MKTAIPFEKRLRKSLEDSAKLPLQDLLRPYFPDARQLELAAPELDRRGVDVVLTLPGGKVGIDLKLLSRDPRRFRRDTIPIELYSVKEADRKGYSGEADYVMWVYLDTRRTVLVRRVELVSFIDEFREEWAVFLEEREQTTVLANGFRYTSIHCNVPHKVIRRIKIAA
ncbi:hypothetical protein [Pelagicoccus mobilis]|uniref:Uncharacterized protein n=1 Tax=Pelagicoccus mobilis TaxID=415221 RepID=A0A934VKZ3_9BACT|nr:hypothetical protein [Pelagicoccus mobilis]MBK1877206.1 hypothetical protein [Pelagicoccus mobilis]